MATRKKFERMSRNDQHHGWKIGEKEDFFFRSSTVDGGLA